MRGGFITGGPGTVNNPGPDRGARREPEELRDGIPGEKGPLRGWANPLGLRPTPGQAIAPGEHWTFAPSRPSLRGFWQTAHTYR
jgi:hypothetical protein